MSAKSSDQSRNSSPSEANVSAIMSIEREAVAARSIGERLGDLIARQAGRLWFIVAHLIWFAVWVLFNAGLIPSLGAFDRYPYQFLNFVVSLEAIFLSLFILMSQNRANKQADARTHLDLQINLLAEQEATKMLQMLQKLCEHHKLIIAKDPELGRLMNPTEPEVVLKELKENLPESG